MRNRSAGGSPRASRPEPSLYFLDADSGEGLLAWSGVSQRFGEARNYWVSTTRPDGRPHAMPVWAVWLDETLYFSTSPLSRKARNLEANPEIVVHLESGDQVIVLEGAAQCVSDEASLARFVAAYNPKYAWSFTIEELAEHRVYAVRPRVAFAWMDSQSPGFGGTATRWHFDDA